MNRRQFISRCAGTALAGSASILTLESSCSGRGPALPLKDYDPQSTLHIPQTRVQRARFPVIDFHTHITLGDDLDGPGSMRVYARPDQILPSMDASNIQMKVDLTGGFGYDLEYSLSVLQKPCPKRFAVFAQPWWNRLQEPDYPRFQADQIIEAHKMGAKGLKILKTLGLRLRENIKTGSLVKIDDPRFNPMWEACGALEMPVAIHTSDPEAFFKPADRFNERYEELQQHPKWSYYGKDYPSNEELQAARCRVMARHPKTQFVCLHVADPENLPYVAECLDAHPNMHVDIAARIAELGRQPRQARKFFDKYQDRILFGTDCGPIPAERFYEPYFRFLETDDEYFPYSWDAHPAQGRWNISGIALPDDILRKVYFENAARLLKLSA